MAEKTNREYLVTAECIHCSATQYWGIMATDEKDAIAKVKAGEGELLDDDSGYPDDSYEAELNE